MSDQTITDTTSELDPEARHRLRLVFFGGVLIVAAIFSQFLFPERKQVADMLALAGALIVALPIVFDVIQSFRSTGYAATQFYMDQFVVIALAACIISGSYITGGIVALILVIGQLLEERAVIGVEQALSHLRRLSQVKANRIGKEDDLEIIDAEELSVGDLIRIRPAEIIPADCVVISGSSNVNQAAITGESLPVEVEPHAEIFAGSTNLNGLLEARVTKTGNETQMGRVARIIEEAQNSEAPVVRLAEEYARYYTPLVMLIAGAVLFFTRDLERAISVIIVSIPCAFVLASPSAMVAAIAAASRLGILIRKTRHIETAGLANCIVFDKTGTLTKGNLRAGKIATTDRLDENQLLTLAASLETNVTHPIARAVVDEAASRDLNLREVTELSEIPGKGVSALVDGQRVFVGRVNWVAEESGATFHEILEAPIDSTIPASLVAVACDGHPVGWIALQDQIRPETPEVLEELRELGFDSPVMLSGDRQAVAEKIAAELGIETFTAECLPETKKEEVDQLRAKGHHVIVVGDGVNDAPALAAADLSFAMGALGNEVAISTADIALMSNDLRRLTDFLRLASKTVDVINQNLLFGFLFIIAAIIVSSLGYVNPILAAFIHEIGAFFVIFNSARLLRFESAEDARLSTEENTPPVAAPTVTVA